MELKCRCLNPDCYGLNTREYDKKKNILPEETLRFWKYRRCQKCGKHLLIEEGSIGKIILQILSGERGYTVFTEYLPI